MTHEIHIKNINHTIRKYFTFVLHSSHSPIQIARIRLAQTLVRNEIFRICTKFNYTFKS